VRRRCDRKRARSTAGARQTRAGGDGRRAAGGGRGAAGGRRRAAGGGQRGGRRAAGGGRRAAGGARHLRSDRCVCSTRESPMRWAPGALEMCRDPSASTWKKSLCAGIAGRRMGGLAWPEMPESEPDS